MLFTQAENGLDWDEIKSGRRGLEEQINRVGGLMVQECSERGRQSFLGFNYGEANTALDNQASGSVQESVTWVPFWGSNLCRPLDGRHGLATGVRAK